MQLMKSVHMRQASLMDMTLNVPWHYAVFDVRMEKFQMQQYGQQTLILIP
jgi:hypothetical protein